MMDFVIDALVGVVIVVALAGYVVWWKKRKLSDNFNPTIED